VVEGGEEEDGDEPEEKADNCYQHDTNVGNSENSANSSDLDNSDDMLQDEEEDLIIDHTATSTFLVEQKLENFVDIVQISASADSCCLRLCCRHLLLIKHISEK
jgi:hypothetical protein